MNTALALAKAVPAVSDELWKDEYFWREKAAELAATTGETTAVVVVIDAEGVVVERVRSWASSALKKERREGGFRNATRASRSNG